MMKIGLSPCPNDTYLFHAWISGFTGSNLPIDPHFADIEQLNQWALSAHFPLIKLSFACFAKVIGSYELLPVGAALGFSCGPKIIAKKPFSLQQLSEKTVAIPGETTTAHLLLNQLLPAPKSKIYLPYHQIENCVKSCQADCGLIIHESRFTFQKAGFVEIVDLGELWHQKTALPLPLGGVAVRRDLSSEMKQKIIIALKSSLEYAQNHPKSSSAFIQKYSQEKDTEIIKQHIKSYITSETAQLSQKGILAIQTLLNCGSPNTWLTPT